MFPLLFQHKSQWHSWLCFNIILLGSFRCNMPVFYSSEIYFLNMKLSANCQSTSINWATLGNIISYFCKNVSFSKNIHNFTYWFKPAFLHGLAFSYVLMKIFIWNNYITSKSCYPNSLHVLEIPLSSSSLCCMFSPISF